MLTSRILPTAEWDKLLTFEPYQTQGLPPEDHWLIIVVERDGVIVANCALIDVVHWDVFQIRPEEQKNPTVVKRLILESQKTMQDLGLHGVHMTLDPENQVLVDLAAHIGFVPSPYRLYIRGVPPAEE